MPRYRNNLSGKTAFKSFIPRSLQKVKIHYDKEMYELLISAETSLNHLNQISVGNNDLARMIFIEAKNSWQLSSGKSDNPYSFICGVTSLTDEDRHEIDDIVTATYHGVEMLSELPLSTRLFLQLHYLITRSPKYDCKYGGEYRKSPVWIGRPESNLQTAQYVAPAVEDMIPAITELENYINYDTGAHPLVQAALIHYQIEALHPFIDANGRFGRLLNTLFLMNKGVLLLPVLQLSEVLKQSSIHYYAHLATVTNIGDYESWIKFFLKTIKDAVVATQRILSDEHIC